MQQVFGPSPIHCMCRDCEKIVKTKIKLQTKDVAHWMALLMCITLIPCCCVPYCLDSLKLKNHYCSECNSYLGTCKIG